jgi:hypothetical protein
LKLAAGVKVAMPAASATVPPTGEPTAVTVSDWAASSAGPGVSFAMSSEAATSTGVSSAVAAASPAVDGASLTGVIVIVTVATFESKIPSFAL